MPSRMARRCGIARRRIACRMDRRVPYRRSPDTASRMVVACGIVRRRIVCRRVCRVRYRSSPDRVPYGPSPDRVPSCPCPCRRPHVSAAFTVGRAEGPSSAMSRPNSACSRRRPQRFTNVYSFVWPWRSMTVQSAARLRRALGRSHPVTRSPDRPGSETSSGIIRHIPGIFRTYSGHISGTR